MQFILVLWAAAMSFWPYPAGAQEPAAVTHAPKLVCDQMAYDFGTMDNNQDVVHTFVLRNAGDLSLEIKQVRSSCGCTVASLSRNIIPPGEQAEVTAKLSLRGRQGPQHKSITVECNDPQQPVVTLYLEGTAISELQIQPPQIFLGRITSGVCQTGAVDITSQTASAVTIKKVSTDSTFLNVSQEAVTDGKAYRILVSTKPPLPLGTFRNNVRVETDS
ncbi:MAG: DUF1573 domain-containing protein, partial [Pseudomonadota bacterium]